MKCICESLSTAANTWSAATGLIAAYTVLGSPQGALSHPFTALPQGQKPQGRHHGPSSESGWGVGGGGCAGLLSSSSYLPLLERPGWDIGLGDVPHRTAAAAMGRGMALGPCHLLSSETPGFALLACGDTDCGTPSVLLLSIYSGPPPPTISLLSSSDLFYQFSPLSHISFSSFHHYFSTVLPSCLTYIILFQTSPQGIYSHWSSYAGEKDWAYKTQLRVRLCTSFLFLLPLRFFSAHCKLGGRDRTSPPICCHAVHTIVLLSREPTQRCSKIEWLRQGIHLPCFLETWKPETCLVEKG